jgi:hypothetical protein
MPSFAFDCAGVAPQRYAATPTLSFSLKVSEESGAKVHSVALRCQLRIEPRRRTYTDADADRLLDIFGERSRWGETLQPLQFATVPLLVPGFAGSTTIELPVPVSYDLEVAAAKYLHGLRDGDIPLLLLFSGSAFYQGESGMQVEQIPWDKEIQVRMPVAVWRETMDCYFPNEGWLRLPTETIDALQSFRSRRALPTWEETFAVLLKIAEGPGS